MKDRITYVVLIAVANNPNARNYANVIEGECFDYNEADAAIRFKDYTHGKIIHDYVHEQFPTLGVDDVQVYSMNDFMELNNDEAYFPNDWFMSYMYVCT